MPTIRLHLETAEYNAVARYAASMKVKPEAVIFSALNRLMLDARNPAVRTDILETADWRRNNLPLWSDSAGSVQVYEGKPDDEPEPSRYV